MGIVTIEKISQNLILTTRQLISSHIAVYRQNNCKELEFMVMNLKKIIQNTQTMKLCYCGSVEVFQFGTFIK